MSAQLLVPNYAAQAANAGRAFAHEVERLRAAGYRVEFYGGEAVVEVTLRDCPACGRPLLVAEVGGDCGPCQSWLRHVERWLHRRRTAFLGLVRERPAGAKSLR